MDVALYSDKTNVPHHKQLNYKFFPDAGNQPTVPASPLNLFVRSIVWVSQGLYRITLQGNGKNLVAHRPHLNVNAAGVVRFCQPGPVTTAANGDLVLDVLVVDASAAVQNPPAANANNFISGEIVIADTGSV